MLVLVGTVCAFIAAVAAIYFGKKSLTKQDLATIEEHTAASSHHLKKQTLRDELIAKIERVPLEIWGQDSVNDPLNVYIRCPDADALPTRISLYNEHGTLFGTASVVRIPDGDYASEIECSTVARWLQGGTPVVVGQGHIRVVLGVNLAIDGQEGNREIAATVRQTFLDTDRGRKLCYVLEGAI
jgi:hypothetical protein